MKVNIWSKKNGGSLALIWFPFSPLPWDTRLPLSSLNAPKHTHHLYMIRPTLNQRMLVQVHDGRVANASNEKTLSHHPGAEEWFLSLFFPRHAPATSWGSVFGPPKHTQNTETSGGIWMNVYIYNHNSPIWSNTIVICHLGQNKYITCYAAIPSVN